MISYLTNVTLAVCLMVARCNAGVNVKAQRRTLLDTDRAMAAAAAAGDTNLVFPYWADDAVIYPAGMPAVRGKAAIRDFVGKNRIQPGFSINWSPFEAVVSPDGHIGYTIGNYQVSIQSPDGSPKIRKGRYVQTWRKDDTGSWKCVVEIQSPLSMPAGPDVRPGLQLEDGALQATPGNEVSGTLSPVGVPVKAPVRIDAGKSCIVELKQMYSISGTLSGSMEINYCIMIAGPCGSPPGTFDEKWLAYGKFNGNINGNSASASLSYTAHVKAGGEIGGRIVLDQGLKGEFHIFGNLKDKKLSYKGLVE